jgi:hypothetical protein
MANDHEILEENQDGIEYVVDEYAKEKEAAKRRYDRNLVIAFFSFIVLAIMIIIALKFPVEETLEYITADELNLRDGPNAQAKIIQPLDNDTVVKVLDDSKDWYFVEVKISNNRSTHYIYNF